MGEGSRGRLVSGVLDLDREDEKQLRQLLATREQSLNRQLGITLFAMAIAYGLCLVCSLTGVFLTGKLLGLLAFLPGMLLLLTGAAFAHFGCKRPECSARLTHVLLLLTFLAIIDVSLIQLVWAVPCLAGFIALVYAYHNPKITAFYNTLVVISVLAMAALNAAFGMPNPDMLPYPETISGIPDGYVTLWAMRHPEEWSRFDYFLRILRFHSLPLLFLLFIVAGFGYALSRRTRQRFAVNIAQSRRIREIETCLLLMAGGRQSDELLRAVLGSAGEEPPATPPLSAAFVSSIEPAEIPRLVRAFRRRCAEDADFAARAARDPEAALRSLR